MPGPCIWLTLPRELWCLIMAYLDADGVGRLACTSKTLRAHTDAHRESQRAALRRVMDQCGARPTHDVWRAIGGFTYGGSTTTCVQLPAGLVSLVGGMAANVDRRIYHLTDTAYGYTDIGPPDYPLPEHSVSDHMARLQQMGVPQTDFANTRMSVLNRNTVQAVYESTDTGHFWVEPRGRPLLLGTFTHPVPTVPPDGLGSPTTIAAPVILYSSDMVLCSLNKILGVPHDRCHVHREEYYLVKHMLEAHGPPRVFYHIPREPGLDLRTVRPTTGSPTFDRATEQAVMTMAPDQMRACVRERLLELGATP